MPDVAGAAREGDRVALRGRLGIRRHRDVERRLAPPRGAGRCRGSSVRSAGPIPVATTFRSRSSTGSMPSSRASLSMFASCAKHTCGAPNPRIAPQGGLFVYTAVPSSSALGTSYGPARKVVAFAITAVDDDANAPPSTTIRPRDGDEASVAGGAGAEPDPRRMAVHVGEEGLLAPVRHLHGPSRVQREHAGVELHVEVLTAPERAADAREGEADLLLGQVQRGRDLLPVDVQPLRRDDEVDAAVLGRDREAGLGSERRLVLHARSRSSPRPRRRRRRRDRRARSGRGEGRSPSRGAWVRRGRARRPCPERGPTPRTRRGSSPRPAWPARASRRRRSRPAVPRTARGPTAGPAGRRTRARRSSSPARPRG